MKTEIDQNMNDSQEFAAETRERLARLETMMSHTATKADLARLEATILKWFIATAVTLAGLAFAAGRFIR